MRNILPLLFAISFNLCVLGQNDQENYFSQGMDAFNNQQYNEAQNFFLLAYQMNKDKNALFNLAATTLILQDTCEACKFFNFLQITIMIQLPRDYTMNFVSLILIL
jgi:thioredoxin-like negative regulator of GroEL